MAQLAGASQTYMDPGRREDLLDQIQDVSPDANYLTTILGTVPVSQTLHEWTEYNTARPTDNSAKTVEGDDNSFSDLTQLTRKNNVTQIIKEVFAVTETQVVVDKVSPKDAYAREMGWAMRRIKNKMEYAVLRGTKASGSSGTAREMNGLIAETVANGLYTVRNSGTSLSENEFRDIMTDSWNTTDEYLIDLMLTTGRRKTDFGRFFTTASPKTIAADDKRLVQALDVVESDFGNLVEVRAHKDMEASSLLAFRKDLAKVGYLRRPTHKPNGVTGDSQKGHIVTELTTQVGSAKPFVYRKGGYNL